MVCLSVKKPCKSSHVRHYVEAMTKGFRVTTCEDGFAVATALGLSPDKDSRPEIFEWYYSFPGETEKDGWAFVNLLDELRPKPFFVFSSL